MCAQKNYNNKKWNKETQPLFLSNAATKLYPKDTQ